MHILVLAIKAPIMNNRTHFSHNRPTVTSTATLQGRASPSRCFIHLLITSIFPFPFTSPWPPLTSSHFPSPSLIPSSPPFPHYHPYAHSHPRLPHSPFPCAEGRLAFWFACEIVSFWRTARRKGVEPPPGTRDS
ncbi:hypothetical protein E2C01_030098 [Portunus trituberculatus]|uniref:Uncharacterized protein n=1 Tax=Portunus trituberculatus TaxID=210409 RepID=A0A5B7ER70_PORTR|nr:hypothetical protein [Portunus trituberculatus]